jgi:hypothetical protein
MRYRWFARGLLLLLAITPGCQAFHAYRPIGVEAMDAETKKPIPGVEIKVSYPLEPSSSAPWESKDTTDSDGIARLKAAPFGRAGVMIEVSAKGYLSEQKYLSTQEVQAIESAHWFEDVNRRPANFVMELFTDPGPTIELIVPVGYRGQFKAKVEVQVDMPAFAGQRSFKFDMPTSGELVASGPRIFRHVTPSSFQLTSANGVPLSQWAKDSDNGYWLVKTEGNWYYFLVGTPRDYDDYRHSLQQGPWDNSVRTVGQDGGKGRRGRKGNSPSDPNP